MIRFYKFLSTTMLITTLTACGGSDAMETTATTHEVDVSMAILNQTKSLQDFATTPIHTIDLSSLFTPNHFGHLLDVTVPHLKNTNASRDQLKHCVTQTEQTTTFTECVVQDHIIDGALSIVESTVRIDILDIALSEQNTINHSFSIEGIVDINNKHLDGLLEIYTDWTDNDKTSSMRIELIFENILFDNNRCPVGGEISVVGSIKHADKDSTTKTKTISFGDSCNKDIYVSSK